MTNFYPRLPITITAPAPAKGRNAGKHYPVHCLLCGRPMRQRTAWVSMVHLMTDRTLADPRDESLYASVDSQGCFPVGPECRFKVALYTFQLESDQVFAEGGA